MEWFIKNPILPNSTNEQQGIPMYIDLREITTLTKDS
jgi:hypothetical protein